MADILLTIMMLAFFAFWFYAADRIGKYVEKNYRGYQEPSAPEKKPQKTGVEHKRAKIVLKNKSGCKNRHALRQ